MHPSFKVRHALPELVWLPLKRRSKDGRSRVGENPAAAFLASRVVLAVLGLAREGVVERVVGAAMVGGRRLDWGGALAYSFQGHRDGTT